MDVSGLAVQGMQGIAGTICAKFHEIQLEHWMGGSTVEGSTRSLAGRDVGIESL